MADRYCYGAVESRVPIVVKEGQDPLDAIARHYLDTSNCPRFMPQNLRRGRESSAWLIWLRNTRRTG
ncbi:MAG: 2-hydroxyacyl-CoA dehydratase family protein [Oscillospiraceae bacterium]